MNRYALIFLCLLGLGPVQARAQGVAELSLDRGAVRALLAAAVARPLTVPVASWRSASTPPSTNHTLCGGVTCMVTDPHETTGTVSGRATAAASRARTAPRS
ncbi:MAG: hypothetical protein O7A07_08870, partial [Acidobacteria bacterium]|nr:hypothetical protein [Acidobacteriota bacterium]